MEQQVIEQLRADLLLVQARISDMHNKLEYAVLQDQNRNPVGYKGPAGEYIERLRQNMDRRTQTLYIRKSRTSGDIVISDKKYGQLGSHVPDQILAFQFCRAARAKWGIILERLPIAGENIAVEVTLEVK